MVTTAACAFFGLVPLLSAPPAGFAIASHGEPSAVVVLPAAPAPEETRAAEEIASYVTRISGAKLDIVTAGADLKGLKPILLGGAADASLETAILARGDDPGSFILRVEAASVSVRGLSPEGTFFGACELLEQLGVRWFMPGELGTVIPKSADLCLKLQSTVQVPSFRSRWHSGSRRAPWIGEWQKHVRMGGIRFPSSHGIELGPEGAFDKHPEYYALIGGVRVRRQLCVSNPDVIKLAAAHLRSGWNGMGPDDSHGFCECPNCTALDAGDYDPYVGSTSMTDRYIWFFNRVLEAAKERCPDAKIGFYAYDTYMRPPLREKPDPRITPALAPITLCRIHGANNPVCPEKNYFLELIRQWRKLCPEVYDRGYWFNLADIGLPFSMVHRMREEIPMEKRLGIAGFRVETSAGSECHWASETPSLYLAAKLMWNSNADVDALLADFYDKFFGPASKPMRGYFETLDAAVRDADYHSGSMYAVPHIYTSQVRKRAAGFLKEAARLADGSDFGRRVEVFRLSFQYLDAFVRTVEMMNAFDFRAASREIARVREMMAKLRSYDPPMLAQEGFPERFLEGFCGRCIADGLEKTTRTGRLLAPLTDEWEFFLDPGGVGLEIGLSQPGVGGNWQKIKAYSNTVGDQGLRYYRGAAWYRQTVAIPEKLTGRRIVLWISKAYVDSVRAWVNGTELERLHPESGLPFEFDATGAVAVGKPATVVIRVGNKSLRELGVAGITGPVMLYAAGQ